MKNLIEKEAEFHARRLLAQAKQNEQQITADLKKIGFEVSAEMVGLEHKFKPEDSLRDKLIRLFEQTFDYLLVKGYTSENAFDQPFLRVIGKTNDVLRYPFILPNDSYIFSFKKIIVKLKELGYSVPEKQIWNAWKNIGTIFDKGYRGINAVIITSQEQKFELQFHTEESFQLKMKTHILYKERSLVSI